MKFDDAIDEWLYSQSADAEEGDSTEGSGWYGRYDAPLMSDAEEDTEEMDADQIAFVRGVKAGAIVFERTDGCVEVDYFDDKADFEEAWTAIEAEHVAPDEDGGDYTTNDHVRFYQYGKRVVTVEGDADWRDAVQAHMDANQFFPNVWLISDHGNVIPLTITKEAK
jgi:hypothetical protein